MPISAGWRSTAPVEVTVTTTTTSDRTLYKEIVEATPNGERLNLCLQCGMCSGICPYGFAMEFPPRSLIAALRAEELTDALNSDLIWLCVSCFACTSVCPVQIPLTTSLLTTFKAESMLRGKVPPELQAALENTRRYGNTLGESPRRRPEWASHLTPPVPLMAEAKEPVDVLWFVGDYASYHPRTQVVSRAMARLLRALDVNFGILGPEENSDGDAQLLSGEKGLYELLVLKNGKAFERYQFKQVVTTDPHAFNVIKNEYPRAGVSVPIQHYTQFLVERLDQLKPLLHRELNARVAYHDPCALGRANSNNVYDEPRQLLQAIPGLELVEMAHNRANTICCGGGGGGNWLDGFVWEQAHTRTSEWRVEEAVQAGAQILAVACPYETPRFEDAVKSTGHQEELIVKDIAELLSEAMRD
jgi:Fe-S oxidoreductase